MNTKTNIDNFVAQKTLAVAGLSRDPKAKDIAGAKCYPTVGAIPERVGGVLVFTPPSETEKVVRDAAAAGIRRLWIQQGAQSEPALRFARENDLEAVSGQCILMFAEPVASFHAFHRWVKRLFGGLPK